MTNIAINCNDNFFRILMPTGSMYTLNAYENLPSPYRSIHAKVVAEILNYMLDHDLGLEDLVQLVATRVANRDKLNEAIPVLHLRSSEKTDGGSTVFAVCYTPDFNEQVLSIHKTLESAQSSVLERFKEYCPSNENEPEEFKIQLQSQKVYIKEMEVK